MICPILIAKDLFNNIRPGVIVGDLTSLVPSQGVTSYGYSNHQGTTESRCDPFDIRRSVTSSEDSRPWYSFGPPAGGQRPRGECFIGGPTVLDPTARPRLVTGIHVGIERGLSGAAFWSWVQRTVNPCNPPVSPADPNDLHGQVNVDTIN